MDKKIAFIAYESPFAPCGGIAAVMGRLPGYMQDASGLGVIAMTPYHHNIPKTQKINNIVGNFSIEFEGQLISINIHKHLTEKWSWYFIEPIDYLLPPDGIKYFAGKPHPYLIVKGNPSVNAEKLRRDALLLGRSIHNTLDVVDPKAEWILMMQDWETATTVLDLASKGKHQNDKYKLFITLHNSYDSGVTDSHLLQVGINPVACPGDTVLQRAIPFVKYPVFTVSEQFALDLVEDDFQAQVMAPHLQELLKPRLLGVNNGPFIDLAFSRDMLQEVREGKLKRLQEWKAENRRTALNALKKFTPSEDKPLWGDLSQFDTNDSACWFVMAGRDDPRQKGYDVAAAAVESFLKVSTNHNGKARFFFFPIPGDEGLFGLDFLKILADNFPDKVLVFPFVWQEGFFATLCGANYGIMPSLYEPFGMANEFYLKGSVGIGRAMGGLLHQIVPFWAASSFSYAAEIRTMRWHSESAHPTGILFKERDHIVSVIKDWNGINTAQYATEETPTRPNRVQERLQYPLFRAMVHELKLSLTDAVNIEPTLYYRMLVEGIDFIQNSLSWERAAEEYVRNVIDV